MNTLKSVTDLSLRADPFRPAWEIWPAGQGTGQNGFRAFIEFYACEASPAASVVLVVPGGGYARLRDAMIIEGHDVALALNRLGFHAAVLKYRQLPEVFPAQQQDLLRAIKVLRGRAAELGFRPDRIAVAGFSAGGHLVACAAFAHSDFDASCADELDAVSARPDAVILGYAALDCTMDFIRTCSRDCPDMAVKGFFEKRLTSSAPPVFIHHAADDTIIPVRHSLDLAAALFQNHVPCELHVFDSGEHAYGIGSRAPQTAPWLELAATWLRRLGF